MVRFHMEVGMSLYFFLISCQIKTLLEIGHFSNSSHKKVSKLLRVLHISGNGQNKKNALQVSKVQLVLCPNLHLSER